MLRTFKNFTIIAVCSSAMLVACSKPEAVTPTETTNTGPFVVPMSDETPTYQNTVKVNIDQEEGGVSYFITTPNAESIQVIASTVNVTGCPASQVTFDTYWIPDSSRSAAQAISAGSVFKTRAGIQGTFRQYLHNLQGCSAVEVSMTLKKVRASSMACKESSDRDCRVEVYCKEKDPLSTFVEVEVWKESWATTLRKFMNRGDGTRGAMSMDSVIVSNSGNERTYSSNSSNSRTTLKVNVQDLGAVYSETVMGNTYTTELTCHLP